MNTSDEFEMIDFSTAALCFQIWKADAKPVQYSVRNAYMWSDMGGFGVNQGHNC